MGILRRGCLEERWVDMRPNQGKTNGAFSAGSRGTHPFILMSYDDSLWFWEWAEVGTPLVIQE